MGATSPTPYVPRSVPNAIHRLDPSRITLPVVFVRLPVFQQLVPVPNLATSLFSAFKLPCAGYNLSMPHTVHTKDGKQTSLPSIAGCVDLCMSIRAIFIHNSRHKRHVAPSSINRPADPHLPQTNCYTFIHLRNNPLTQRIGVVYLRAKPRRKMQCIPYGREL